MFAIPCFLPRISSLCPLRYIHLLHPPSRIGSGWPHRFSTQQTCHVTLPTTRTTSDAVPSALPRNAVTMVSHSVNILLNTKHCSDLYGHNVDITSQCAAYNLAIVQVYLVVPNPFDPHLPKNEPNVFSHTRGQSLRPTHTLHIPNYKTMNPSVGRMYTLLSALCRIISHRATCI